jgi:tetratricopeptide (TPR) repeat protein
MKALLGFSLALLTLFALPVCAQEQRRITQPSIAPTLRRVALIIGNSAYAIGPLKNPVNDARAMTTALRGLGFDVIHKEDLKREDMRRAIRDFGLKISKGSVGLFYYAGHGVQVRGENYLIPVDAAPESADEIDDDGVNAGYVLEKMESAGNGMNIVILDACRNNPFTRSFRSGSDGLASINAPTGTLIAYATAPGAVASDGGNSGNGVYTQELLKILKTPGLGIEEVFKRVRVAVRQRTQGRQTPWESSSLVGDFYFSNRRPDGVTPASPAGSGESSAGGRRLYESGLATETSGDLAGAAGAYRAAILLDPENALYHNALGNVLAAEHSRKLQDYFAESARDLKKSRDTPFSLKSVLELREFRVSPIYPAAALQEFRKAMKLAPGNAQYRHDFVGGWHSSRPSDFLGPPIWQSQEQTAQYQAERVQQFKAMEDDLREVLRLEPDNAWFHASLGIALRGQERWGDAEAEYAEAARLDPRNPGVRDDLAKIQELLGKVSEAVNSYREAIRLDPQTAFRRIELAKVLGKQLKWAEAEAEYKEAIRLQPQSDYSHSSFGDALSEQGKWADALREYKEALRLAPEKDDSPYGLGVSFSEQLQQKIKELEKKVKKSKR